MIDEFEKNEISGCWSSISSQEDLLLFFSDQSFQENNNHKLVVFDPKEQIIVDQWQLESEEDRRGFNINGPILRDGYVIAEEQNGQIHLFELSKESV